MLVAPDTTARVASTETVSLGLDADAQLAQVRLLPRFGAEATIDLDADGTFPFPAFASPDAVRVDWLSSSSEPVFASHVAVVSRHYFPLDALRGYGDGQDDFADLPEDTLREARQAATEVFEQAARRSFVARLGRTRDYGRDGLLWLAHGDVREVLTEGYAQVSDCQCERTGACRGAFPRWVEYVYGADGVPSEVSRAVLSLAAYVLRPSNRPVGATGESTDAGYIHFTTAGRDGATSIPEVNAAIEQFGRGECCVW